jgi:cytochrome c-type biogenesis protein CcmF
MHTSIGYIGHFAVLTSFVMAALSAFSYFKTSQIVDNQLDKNNWLRLSRITFAIHSASVFAIVASLFYIIHQHYYEYHYAWSHSSNNLPVYYMISCFWEGQEGSFLLWIFWHVCLGLVLMKTAKTWEAPVMSVFAMVQAFLSSMILGIVIFGELKIGSSPFLLLKEAMADLPVFKLQPDFIPKDGNGLNPLLQNYWMVIHPPTLFLGFALTLVPFAYVIAGLQQKKYKEWIKPALPWVLFGGVVLGIGIMMGAYWAYETLNFGGYWNWDPVENAVYVPWLLLVATLHVMITYQRSKTGLRASMILAITTFLSILYATFLTRSGVLGNASVHSFTDLGLSGQLIIYLAFFVVIAIIYLAINWKKIPTTEKELSIYSKEFWLFIGATTLCLAGFQVLIPTSIPVYNAFLGFVGIKSNLAPPSDQIQFYTKFQLWFAIAITVISGTAQFFWWNNVNKENEKSPKALLELATIPLTITMLVSAVIILVAKIHNWQYIILTTFAVYSIVSNAFVLYRLAKTKTANSKVNPILNLSGGAVSHIGIALMLLGILFSAGYSTVISQNTSGLLYNREFTDEMNKEHLLLFRNQPQYMKAVQTDAGIKYEYSLTYKGLRVKSADFPTYIDKELLQPTINPYRMVTSEDLTYKGKTYFTKGDTLQVYFENTYYEVEYEKLNSKTGEAGVNNQGEKFLLYPRIQTNEKMGNGVVPSPDVSMSWKSDLYTHITNIPDPEKEKKWANPETYNLTVGDTFVINDYIAIFESLGAGNKVDDEDVNATATVRLLGNNKTFTLKPAYLIKGNMVRKIADTNESLGVKLTLEAINPQDGKITFIAQTTQKDWIILKAVEFPLIGLLWIGTLIMAVGMSMAMWRRYVEAKEAEGKKKEVLG